MRIVILKSDTPQFTKKKIGFGKYSGKLTRTCHVKGLPVSKFASLQIKIYDIQTKLELGTVFKNGTNDSGKVKKNYRGKFTQWLSGQ